MTGTVRFGVDEHGFAVSGTNHIIGGGGPEDGNIVADTNFYNGLELSGSGHVVYGNFIGTDRSGTIDLGNLHAGIVGIGNDLTIGGTGPGEGNTIAFNAASGYLASSSRASRSASAATESTATTTASASTSTSEARPA